MRVTLATDPGTAGWPNEDFAAVAPGAAVLLDGATTPRGASTGCVSKSESIDSISGEPSMGGSDSSADTPLESAGAEAEG